MRGCLLSYSQAEPGRELTQPSPHLLAEPCTMTKVIQGWPKRWTPGSVNMKRKNCVLLTAAGRKTQPFHLKFTEPGVHLLGHPCITMTAFGSTTLPISVDMLYGWLVPFAFAAAVASFSLHCLPLLVCVKRRRDRRENGNRIHSSLSPGSLLVGRLVTWLA